MENNLIGYKAASTYTFDPEKKLISGYGAAFNTKDSDKDIIVKGAFSEAVKAFNDKKNKVAFVWMHNLKDPIGKIVSLEEDDYGLKFLAELDDVENGLRAQKQYASGTLNQHSIGFRYDLSAMKYDKAKDANIVTNIKRLFEISPVTIGANENTPFLGFKGEGGVNAFVEAEINDYCKGLEPENEYMFLQFVTKMKAAFTSAELKADIIKEIEKRESELSLKSFLVNLKYELSK